MDLAASDLRESEKPNNEEVTVFNILPWMQVESSWWGLLFDSWLPRPEKITQKLY